MRIIFFVRHAQCEMNLHLAEKVSAARNRVLFLQIGGQSNDSPLTPLGVRQAEALGKRLRASGRTTWSCFHASTAVRAMETARLAMEVMQEGRDADAGALPAVQLSSEILECDMGEWEGCNRSATYTAETLQVINADPWNFAPPGGESQRQVEERMWRYMRQVVLPQVPAGSVAVVISHGLAIKCFLRGLLDFPASSTRRIILDNTSLTEVAFSDDLKTSQLRRINDAAHLRDGCCEANAF